MPKLMIAHAVVDIERLLKGKEERVAVIGPYATNVTTTSRWMGATTSPSPPTSTTIFLAEWGDLTQILTANLAVRYHAPLSVGLGRCWPSGRSRPWRCSAVVGSCA